MADVRSSVGEEARREFSGCDFLCAKCDAWVARAAASAQRVSDQVVRADLGAWVMYALASALLMAARLPPVARRLPRLRQRLASAD